VTSNVLTVYERTRIIGERAERINAGKGTYIDVSDFPSEGTHDGYVFYVNEHYEAVKKSLTKEDEKVSREKIYKVLLENWDKLKNSNKKSDKEKVAAYAQRSHKGLRNPIRIALEELKQEKLPMFIHRPLPNGTVEQWKVSELRDLTPSSTLNNYYFEIHDDMPYFDVFGKSEKKKKKKPVEEEVEKPKKKKSSTEEEVEKPKKKKSTTEEEETPKEKKKKKASTTEEEVEKPKEKKKKKKTTTEEEVETPKEKKKKKKNK
jgi:DNA-directed RNA polymerase subunit K/omega